MNTEPAPNTTRIHLWADELATTTKKQGRGVLRRGDDTYCCLGIAVEVAIANGCPAVQIECVNGSYWYGHSTERGAAYYLADSSNLDLPRVVAQWYGLDANPTVGHHAEKGAPCHCMEDGGDTACEQEREPLYHPAAMANLPITASDANDTRRWNFQRIANALKALYPKEKP